MHCKHLLLVFAIVPVVSLMLAGQEVGPVVPLALHEFQEILGTVVPLLQRQLGQVHLLLSCYHLWQRDDKCSASSFNEHRPDGNTVSVIHCFIINPNLKLWVLTLLFKYILNDLIGFTNQHFASNLLELD